MMKIIVRPQTSREMISGYVNTKQHASNTNHVISSFMKRGVQKKKDVKSTHMMFGACWRRILSFPHETINNRPKQRVHTKAPDCVDNCPNAAPNGTVLKEEKRKC